MVKVHAANLYGKAMALNLISGVDEKVANKRIAEAKSFKAQGKKPKEKGLYMIVDLMKSGKWAVSHIAEAPKNGWSDEFRTKKIVLRKIALGSFEYVPGKSIKLTKPFYIGVFEVTQKQYETMMNANPSEFKGDMRPVERVSYFSIRGRDKGLGWPKDNQVDADSYIGKKRRRFGLEFDLPTAAQWEYACRAGTTGDFNVDGVEMVKLGKCAENGGQNDNHVKVGSFMPNAWGLYDMHGNVSEWCIDRWGAYPANSDTDPIGPKWGSDCRVVRDGHWHSDASSCRSAQRYYARPQDGVAERGFRLCCPAVP